MLEIIKVGLNEESAREICQRLLPETRAMAIAVTDDSCVLACVGEARKRLPHPARPSTRPPRAYVLEHGVRSRSPIWSTRQKRAHRAPRHSCGHHRAAQGARQGYRHAQVLLPPQPRREPHAVRAGHGFRGPHLHAARHPRARAARRAHRPAPSCAPCRRRSNPHFLFNTLNTIAALTRTEPLRAPRASARVLVVLRATLENSGSFIPLSREVAQTSRYLLFEKRALARTAS